MSYVISGPITQNDVGALNTMLGNTTLSNSGVGGAAPLRGQVYYVDSSLQIRGLATGTAGQVLITNGTGADPSWATSSIATNGFSVAKTAGDTFSSTQTVVASWNTTTPSGVSTNPFFNTGSPDFNTTTGIYTPSTSGTYKIDANFQFTVTNTGDDNTLVFAEQTTGPVYNAIVTMGPIQPRPQLAGTQSIQMSAVVKLLATKTYVLTIQSGGTNGTKTISSNTRFSCLLTAV